MPWSRLRRRTTKIFAYLSVSGWWTHSWNTNGRRPRKKDFAQCVRLKPDHIASLSNLAAARARMNDSRHAVQNWKTILDAGPAPRELVQNVGRYRQVLESHKLKAATGIVRVIDGLIIRAADAEGPRYSTNHRVSLHEIGDRRRENARLAEGQGLSGQMVPYVRRARQGRPCPQQDCDGGTVWRNTAADVRQSGHQGSTGAERAR